MRKIDEKTNKYLLELHASGLTNRQIAQEIGVGHGTITKYLKMHGVKSNWANDAIDIVDEFNAKCKRCKLIKPLEEFQHGRRGQKYEYKFAYCNKCRRNQIYYNLNNNFISYLKNRYNTIRRKSIRSNVVFTISFEEIYSIWEQQCGKCFYTDIEMKWKVGNGLLWHAVSFDKIIPVNGYVYGNVVLCTRKANAVKNDLTLDEMKAWVPGWHARILRMWESHGLTTIDVGQGVEF